MIMQKSVQFRRNKNRGFLLLLCTSLFLNATIFISIALISDGSSLFVDAMAEEQNVDDEAMNTTTADSENEEVNVDVDINDENDGDDEPLTSTSDLDNFSESELEDICIQRGFEVVKEDNVNYTHEDYVDAARQCLFMEEEMEKALQEDPEFLKELEDERNRMMEEKQKLEEQLLALLREEEEKAKLLSAAAAAENENQSTSSDDDKDADKELDRDDDNERQSNSETFDTEQINSNENFESDPTQTIQPDEAAGGSDARNGRDADESKKAYYYDDDSEVIDLDAIDEENARLNDKGSSSRDDNDQISKQDGRSVKHDIDDDGNHDNPENTDEKNDPDTIKNDENGDNKHELIDEIIIEEGKEQQPQQTALPKEEEVNEKEESNTNDSDESRAATKENTDLSFSSMIHEFRQEIETQTKFIVEPLVKVIKPVVKFIVISSVDTFKFVERYIGALIDAQKSRNNEEEDMNVI